MADVTREKYKAKKINEYRQTLPEFCGEYCDELKEKSSATQYLYLQDLNNFFRYLAESVFHVDDMKNVTADEFFSTVTEETIFEYFRTREDSPSFTDSSVTHGKEITRLISIFKSFFSFFRKHGYITVDPSSTLVHSNQTRSKAIVCLNDEELEKIRSVYTASKDSAALCKTIIVNLMLHYGMSLSDISGFTLSDFNYCEKTLRIVRFNEDYQVLLGDSDAELIHSYLNHRNLQPFHHHNLSIPLLVNSRGTKLQHRLMQTLINDLAEDAEIQTEFTQNTLRSTFAQRYYDATRDVELIRIMLGKEYDPIYKHIVYKKRDILEISDKAF